MWQRGADNDPVIVVANFSDFETDKPFAPSPRFRAQLAAPPGFRVARGVAESPGASAIRRARIAVSVGSEGVRARVAGHDVFYRDRGAQVTTS